LLCRVLGRPLLMTHHGDVVMPGGWFNQFVQTSAYWVLRFAGMLAHAVTSYSRDYADHSPLLAHFSDLRSPSTCLSSSEGEEGGSRLSWPKDKVRQCSAKHGSTTRL
jgi:hypothetical protein